MELLKILARRGELVPLVDKVKQSLRTAPFEGIRDVFPTQAKKKKQQQREEKEKKDAADATSAKETTKS